MDKLNAFHDDKGRITYSRNILNSIILLATEEVPGVASTRSEMDSKKSPIRSRPEVKVDFCRDGIFVDVSVRVKKDCRVPDVAFNIQESVKRGIETMTEYKVVTINVNVLDVEFEDNVEEST